MHVDVHIHVHMDMHMDAYVVQTVVVDNLHVLVAVMPVVWRCIVPGQQVA